MYGQQPKYNAKIVDPERSKQGNIEDISKQYGNINYDDAEINKIFQKDVDAQFAQKQKGYDRSTGQFYDRLGQSQSSMMDAFAQERNNAVMSGASAGMQSSNAMKALMGLQQDSIADNTALTQEQRGLVDEYAAAKIAAQKEAMGYADQNKLAAYSTDVQRQAVDAQNYAAELGSNATLAGEEMKSDAQIHTANQGLAGAQYGADRALDGARANANANVLVGDMNLQGTVYNADRNYESSTFASQADYSKQVHADTTALLNQYFGSDAAKGGPNVMDIMDIIFGDNFSKEHNKAKLKEDKMTEKENNQNTGAYSMGGLFPIPIPSQTTK